MSLNITCRNGHKLKAKEELIGRKIPCPKCGAVVLIEVPAEEMLADLGAFAIEEEPQPSSDSNDPFGNLGINTDPQALGNLDFGDLGELAQPYPFSATSADPLAAQANWESPLPNAVTSDAKTPITQASAANPKQKWLAAAILGAIGFLPGIAIGTPLLAWMWSDKQAIQANKQEQAGANSPLQSHLVESKVLREEVVNSVKKALEARDPIESADKFRERIKGLPEDRQKNMEKQYEQRVAQQEKAVAEKLESLKKELIREREIYPEYLFVTAEEEKLLASGKPIDASEIRRTIFQQAIKELDNVNFGRPSEPQTPSMLEINSQNLVYAFRRQFMHLKSIDAAKWNRLKELEAQNPNAKSMFDRLNEPVEEKKLEMAALDFNLREICLAIANFESTFKVLPSSDGFPRSKTGGLSWRVAILPFLGYNNLYIEFKLDEPWDSDHNKKLLSKMPFEFRTQQTNKVGYTTIISTMGTESLIRKGQSFRLNELKANASYTAMLVAGGPDTAIPWTCPDERAFDSDYGIKDFGAGSPLVVLFADITSRKLPATLSDKELQSLVSVHRKQGLPASLDSLCPKLSDLYSGKEEIIYHLRRLDPTR